MAPDSEVQNRLAEHPTLASIVIYAAICVPAYLWLEGPVGTAGTVDGSVAVAGLVLGSLLVVPIIRSVIRNRFGGTGVRIGLDTS